MQVKRGKNVFIHSRAYVAGDVVLGDNANIWCGACIRGDIAPVIVGKNTNVQDNVTVHVGYGKPAVLGEGVTVGHNAVVHGARIGNDVLVGMGAVIMDNAVVPDGTVIAAGAVVLANSILEPGIYAGVPAKKVKEGSEKITRMAHDNAAGYLEYKEWHR